jgi:putative membrane protein
MQKVNNNGVAFSIQRATWVRQLMLALMLCVSVGFMTGCDEDDDGVNNNANSQLDGVDRTFLEMSVQSNLFEIESSNLAKTKTTNPQVVAYADSMIQMHTTAQNAIKALAEKRKFSIASELNDKNKSIRDNLNSLSGANFDRAYINAQVTGHQATQADFQTEIDNGKDAELKAFAVQNKPMIDQHLVSALRIKNANNF